MSAVSASTSTSETVVTYAGAGGAGSTGVMHAVMLTAVFLVTFPDHALILALRIPDRQPAPGTAIVRISAAPGRAEMAC